MTKKNLIGVIISVIGIILAFFLSWLHGTAYDKDYILVLSTMVGFVSAFLLVQIISKIIKNSQSSNKK